MCTTKCGNCGGAHQTRDCPKPLLPLDERPCFNCGEKGHQSKDCPQPKTALPKPKAKPRPAPRGANVVDDSVVTCLVCVDEDGFETVRHRDPQRPTDLSCFRASVAGLSQRERHAQGQVPIRNVFQVLGLDDTAADATGETRHQGDGGLATGGPRTMLSQCFPSPLHPTTAAKATTANQIYLLYQASRLCF